MRMRSVSSLFALLLAAGLAAVIGLPSRAAAQTAEPLTLTLTAERSECTAGTLNPVSWTITGGTAPYTLTVAGQSVDPTAESVNVTCGALPDGATEAPATISAVVTDAAGTTVTAGTAYTIVPPLPAPMGLSSDALRTVVYVRWGDVAVVATAPSATADCPCPLYLLRWRVAGEDSWMTRLQPVTIHSRPGNAHDLLGDLREGTPHEWAVAALRDAIEQETPAALAWSSTVTATTAAPATGVRATATHDTVTVTWDPQPAARSFSIAVRGPRGTSSQGFTPDGSTPHQVVFHHLPPSTEYRIQVFVDAGYQSPLTEITMSTTAAPTGWTPLPRGPQSLRTAVTHNSVTVSWDAPHAGAHDVYHVTLVPPAGLTQRVTVHSGVTAHTFTGLQPATSYQLFVRHSDIVSGRVEVAVTTLARAPRPLTLTLTAGRADCTAGTPNPVTWEMEGGVEPYRLTVDGASVDPDAESATITCGALPEGASAAPGAITGAVTDAAGATTTASAAYTIVPPLPAPRLRPGPATVEETLIIMSWRPVPGARPAGRVGHYLLRWRPAAASTWRYVAVEDNEPLKPWIGGIIWELEGGATYQHQSAAMRDPIEQETPQQLAWSATQTTTTAHPPTGVVATATHNTLTVRWNPQSASLVWITLNPRQAGMRPIDHSWRLGDQPADQVTFVALKPATTYTITVSVQGDFPERLSTSIQARTTSAPPGWTPPRRGPQNVRASATHDSITVRWEHPHTGAPPIYQVFVAHPTAPGRHVELVRGRTEFTLGLLEPETTYTVEIRHLGLIKAPVTVEVRTNAPPTTGPSASPTLTCFEYLVGAVVCTWETSLARPPV